MNKWLEILAGVVFLTGSVYVAGINLWGFKDAALAVLQGGLIWGVFFVGLMLIILGISDLKE